MSNALEVTRDIVVAAFSSTSSFYPDKDSGENVAEFIQAVYDKIKGLEDQMAEEDRANSLDFL